MTLTPVDYQPEPEPWRIWTPRLWFGTLLSVSHTALAKRLPWPSFLRFPPVSQLH